MQLAGSYFWIIFHWSLVLILAQKKIIFTSVQCPLRSSKLTWIECTIEDNSTISIQGATNDNEVVNVVGIAELLILGGKQRIRVPGIRLDFCKILTASSRRSLLTFFNKGIQQADNNFPKKCPFKRNTTYRARHMKFDANYLPNYLPEYNFSFIGKFMENDAMLFEVRAKGSFCYINNDCTGAGANSSAT